MEQGYNQEAAEQAEKAFEKLSDVKEANEFANYYYNLPPERQKVFLNVFKANLNMTEEQHIVWYAHINQGFSFTTLGDLRGYTPQGARKHFKLASKKLQKIEASEPAKVV